MKRSVFAILVIFLALIAILVVVYFSHATSSDALIHNASPTISRDTAINLENDSAEVSVPADTNNSLDVTPTALPSADGAKQPPDGGSGPGGALPSGGMPPSGETPPSGGSPPPGGAPPGGSMTSNGGASPTASPTSAASTASSSIPGSIFGSGTRLPTSTTGTSTSWPTSTQQTAGSGSSLLSSLNLTMPTIKPITN